MSDSELPTKALTQAISVMLKPLVRLLMLKNISYVGLLALLKQTFVEVALDDKVFHLSDKKQTDSRVSLLTGVHRKEIKRIREERDGNLTQSALKASLSAQIMSRWLGHSKFLDKAGKPLPLYKKRDQGLSFEDLVFEVSKDKHPRSILDDWIKQKHVKLDQEGRIHLISQGYTSQQDEEERLFFAGKNISEHMDAVTHNLTTHEQPLFERAVYYNNLSEQSVEKIQQLVHDEMLKVLTKVNQQADILQQQDAATLTELEKHYSFHVGSYFNKKEETNE